MKIIYSWLKDFIDLQQSPEKTAEILTSLGIEVEELEFTGARFTGVRVAHILKIDRHPNADRLSLVELETGSGKKTVVCGAKNIAVGQKIPLAQVGAKLPGGVLEKAKIRGIESEGMICSAHELNLPMPDNGGIMVLDSALEPGADVSKLFGEPDCVFGVKLPPNRPDLLSHFGVARELSVCLGLALKTPVAKLPPAQGVCIPVFVEASELCSRYAGRTIRNVSAAQSPDWMKRRLEMLGVKPRNILVDATNYVLYELGYPLHAFDLAKIEGGEIHVRRATDGEKFNSLSGRELTLDSQCLVIADTKKPVALAGVIGGADSGVSDATTDIFLEAAWFDPPSIHKTARRFGERTEAAQRFEGGADIESAAYASARAAELIVSACNGAQITEPVDIYPQPRKPSAIEFTPEKINSILGTAIAPAELSTALKRLSSSLDSSGAVWKITPPSYRRDIETKWDVAEEAARICGFATIGDEPRPVTLGAAETQPVEELCEKWRDELSALGFYETLNYDFMSEKELALYGFSPETAVELANPLSADWRFLRPTLLCGLVKSLVYNENRGAQSACLYEAGKIYRSESGKVVEESAFSGLMSGNWPADIFWRAGETKKLDFYHLKGIAARLFAGFDGVRLEPLKNPPAFLHPKLSLAVLAGKRQAGYIGALHPSVAQSAGLRNNELLVFEILTEPAAKQLKSALFSVKPVPQFPSSWRDISVVVPSQTEAGKLMRAARSSGGEFISAVEMVDLYEGKNMGEGKKSVTFRLVFTPKDRTLTDAEIDAAFKSVLSKLTTEFGAALRS